MSVAGWSAHHAGHESLSAKVLGRTADLLRVHARILSWRPDVVYVVTAHNWPGLLRDLPLALTVPHGRPPLVLHFHGSDCDRLGRPGSRMFTALSKLLVQRAAAVLLLSSEEQMAWRRLSPDTEFEVVLNPFVPSHQGARPAAAAPRGDRVPTVFTVARLIPEKGVFDLLEAVALVRRRRECRLLVAGTGPAREELIRHAARLGIGEAVEFLGYVSGAELDEAYRNADLFVLPTYFAEGFPLSIMEAMSYGLPIVTTRIRGAADWLEEGRNGRFVPPREPAVLAEVIEDLLADPDLCEHMSRENFAAAGDFSPETVLPRYADVLRAAAGRGSPA